MAERLFRRVAGDRHEARSAGSNPGSAPLQGFSRRCRRSGSTRRITSRTSSTPTTAWGDIAVSTCSEEVCPVTPGVRRISWVFADPKDRPLEQIKPIRDEIEKHVEQLVQELD
jgi:protein-tyrosine-phosphatase